MATSNLKDFSVGQVSIQTGTGGIPDHTAISGTTYMDLGTGFLYTNTDGAAAWSITSIKTLGLLSLWADLPFFNAFSAQSLHVVNLSASTIHSGGTPLDRMFTLSGTTARIQSGLNIYTGGTATSPVINVATSPIFTGVTAQSFSGTSISASTYYSGATELGSLFAPASLAATYVQPGTNVFTGGTVSRPIVHVLGSPTFTGVTAQSVSGTSISATTFFSGSTELGSLFSGGHTRVQPGTNITTGGTANAPVVNIAPSINLTGVTAQSVSGTSVSAATFYSGSTELGSLFAPASVIPTYVQPGTNVFTGGTASRPVIHVLGSPTFTGVTAQSVSGTSVSAATFYSGNTNLNDILGQYVREVTPGTNIQVDGDGQHPIISLSDRVSVTTVTSVDIGSSTMSATTFYSGSTELSTLFGGASATYIQPGTNVFTGGTASRPIVHVLGSPTFTGVTAQSVSGTSVSAATYYSGSTELGSLFARLSHDHSGGISFTMDGGSSAISTGQKGFVIVPYSGTITSWMIISDTAGSIVVDVWKTDYNSYPPSVANTITGSEKPTLSSANKNRDLALSTWTTSFSAGDIFTINVDSVATVRKVTLLLQTIKLD